MKIIEPTTKTEIIAPIFADARTRRILTTIKIKGSQNLLLVNLFTEVIQKGSYKKNKGIQ